MGLVNFTYLQKFSGVLRWLDENGSSVKSTTLSDTSVGMYCWGVDGDYFFTASNTSTGRIEKWARNGTAYTWRITGIDTYGVYAMAADSSDNLYLCKQDDIYILDESDGATNYSDVGNELSGYNPGCMVVDSSGNCFIAMTGASDRRLFKFDNTLTKSWDTQISSSYGSCYGIALDGSGNIFVAHGSVLEKFNSSGVSQWSHTPTSGNVSDVKIANSGKVYGCSNQYVFRLTDNGSSRTEDWEKDIATSYSFYAYKIAVTDTQILCCPQSGSWDIYAIDESDGTEDTGFTSYDISNEILFASLDPLATATVGSFELINEIQYSRWVKTGGDIDCGHLEMANNITVRGYGNELIDKLYTKGNYSSIGTPTPRYENFVMVGDPMSEDFGIKAVSTQTYTYNIVVDDEYSMYIWAYAYYTAQEADDASGGFYTSAGSYWNVRKYNSSGVFQWGSNIIIGTPDAMAIDQDYEYIYILTSYISGAITKWSCANGEEYTDTNWPIDFLDISDSNEPGTFAIGRDNKLYCAMNDASDSSLPKLWKWDLDGTTATNWSTPYSIPQGSFGTGVNCIDITDDGTIAIGCIKIGDNGDAIQVINSGKTEDWAGQLPSGDNSSGCDYILIHDDDEYVIAETASGIRKITGETSGICDVSWTVADVSSTGEGYLYNPFWSYDQDYFYAYSSLIASSHSMRKYAYSDGAVEWKAHGDDDTEVSFAAVAPIPVPAWRITVTFGSNGTVKTYYGGDSDGGVPLTSGDVVLAEAGKDFTFMFVGDSNGTDYYVDEVTVDSVNLGYRSNYTFENVLNNHTIHVTFGTGFPSGPFTMNYSMTGGILETANVGKFLTTSALTLSSLAFNYAGGPHTLTHTISGEGYLPWDISLLYLINAERSDNAVDSVVEHAWLVDGAEYAVADLIANGSLTLTAAQIMGQDGANYPYLYAFIIPAILDESFTPQDLFDAWMLDPPTAAGIINSNYEEVGIYVENYDGDNYVCVVMAQWHPQYTVERMTENFNITLSLPTAYFFDFLSAEKYTELISNTSVVKLPEYAANIGNYEIPNLLSFNYRMELGVPSQLRMTCIFTNEVMDEIELREDDSIFIESIFYSLGTETRTAVLNVDFTEFEMIAGESPKLSISGYEELRYYESTAELRNVMTRVKDEQGKTRFRCSQPDFYLRPGCTATWGTYSITIEKIVIFVNNGVTQYMEITGE